MNTLSGDQLSVKIRDLQQQLDEANEMIEAIRTGQVDALIVSNGEGPALYTLKSADQSYRLFIEKMTAGAVSVNTDGTILYTNSAFARMVGLPLTKVLGYNFSDFIVEEKKADFFSIFSHAWKEEIISETCLEASERQVPVQLSLNQLELDGGVSMSIIVTDLTQQKESERELKEKNDQLEELNDALGKSNYDLQQFASVASHDLQEPLRKIQVYSKFIKDKSLNELSDLSKDHLEKIISAAARMKVLILDILSYSGLSADNSKFEPVDLRRVVNEVLEDFELMIREKNAVVEVGELPIVEVNKGQIRQVIQNLISNGLKFTKPEVAPHIKITAPTFDVRGSNLPLQAGAEYCKICVTDNGIGFDEKYAASIFSLFEKLNPKSTFEGSGIGLAIAKKIMDKHHGFIIAQSREGDGAEFCIILPLKQPTSHG